MPRAQMRTGMEKWLRFSSFSRLFTPQRELFALARRDVEHPTRLQRRPAGTTEFGLRGSGVRSALLFALLLFGFRLEFVVDGRFVEGIAADFAAGFTPPTVGSCGSTGSTGVPWRAPHPRHRRRACCSSRAHAASSASADLQHSSGTFPAPRAPGALRAWAPEKGQKHHGRRRNENEDGLVRHGRWLSDRVGAPPGTLDGRARRFLGLYAQAVNSVRTGRRIHRAATRAAGSDREPGAAPRRPAARHPASDPAADPACRPGAPEAGKKRVRKA